MNIFYYQHFNFRSQNFTNIDRTPQNFTLGWKCEWYKNVEINRYYPIEFKFLRAHESYVEELSKQ